MSSFGDDAPTLIYTKLHRPRLNLDLVSRPHLIQQLNRGIDRKLTLISAQAGAGKSTLLAQWLEQCPLQSAWLSLDDDDNDLIVFVSYLCAAIQTVFPGACERALDLVNAPAGDVHNTVEIVVRHAVEGERVGGIDADANLGGLLGDARGESANL